MPRGIPSKRQIDAAQDVLVAHAEDAMRVAEEGLERVPGRKRGLTKTAWSYADLEKLDKWVGTPPESVVMTWNGLQWTIKADVENTIPMPIYIAYMQWREAKSGRKTQTKLRALGVTKEDYAGAL